MVSPYLLSRWGKFPCNNCLGGSGPLLVIPDLSGQWFNVRPQDDGNAQLSLVLGSVFAMHRLCTLSPCTPVLLPTQIFFDTVVASGGDHSVSGMSVLGHVSFLLPGVCGTQI